MKKLIYSFFAIVVLFSFPYNLLSAGLKELPKKYRMWLERDVRYIITDKERDAFLKLKTDKERNFFIKMFWKMRDPTPGTPRNEYKEEHYKRLAMAERLFRDEGKPGWRTDRGRFYILLGKPQDIERYDGMGRFYPVEVWYYQGDPAKGLPSQFRLVFYQDPGTFEYKLYYPGIDSPQKLLPTWGGDPFDKMQGYNVIRQYAPSLADALMSMIPGEGPTDYSSARSSLILSQIERSPYENVNTEYAEKILNMEGFVDVETSIVYIPNQSELQLFKTQEGFFVAHFSISPKKFTITEYEGKYYAPIEIYIKLTNPRGESIWEHTYNMELYFSPSQIQRLKNSSVQINGIIPLISGKFSATILLKNKASKEFSVVEKNVLVPDTDNITITTLAISNSLKEMAPGMFIKPFMIGASQFYPYPDEIYRTRDNLVLYGQVNIPEGEKPSNISLKVHISNEEGNYSKSFILPIADFATGLFYKRLGNLPPGSYEIKAEIYRNGLKLGEKKKEFMVTPLRSKPSPFVISKMLNFEEYPIIYHALATQSYKTGKYKLAEIYYKKEFDSAKDKTSSVEGLMRVYLKLGEEERALNLFYSSEKKSSEMCFLAGSALYARGDIRKAIKVLNQGYKKNSVDLKIINLLAEAYLKIGNKENAKLLLKRSLSIDPNQDVIRKKLDLLK